jgi:hypothetical protein
MGAIEAVIVHVRRYFREGWFTVRSQIFPAMHIQTPFDKSEKRLGMSASIAVIFIVACIGSKSESQKHIRVSLVYSRNVPADATVFATQLESWLSGFQNQMSSSEATDYSSIRKVRSFRVPPIIRLVLSNNTS